MGIWKSRKRKWNGNWKWKLEMEIGNENGNKNAPITGAMFSSQCALSLLLYHLLSNGYRTGFMSRALLLCCALWLLLLSSTHVASNVAIQSGSRVRGSGHETSCYLIMRVLEQGQHSYPCSLVPRPTSSFDCLQCVKQIMALYQGSGYNNPMHSQDMYRAYHGVR